MKPLSQIALFKGGHEISGKSSKAVFGCHRSDLIEKMTFLLEPQANPPCPSNAQQTLGDHVAERRTPARQSDGTQCSGVLFSLDIAQWRWAWGERGSSSLGARSNTHPLGHRSDCCSASCKRQHVTRDILHTDITK